MHSNKYDPSMEKLKPGQHVGVVGESHIWDGPLDQAGRPHGKGASNGINGMQILKAPSMYKAGPITQLAKGSRGMGME
mgnify:CR=1 FL=1|tara:strand:+ start:273 stop:506 length:234 start_codon:yes stop_codon:yes gene_type:complete